MDDFKVGDIVGFRVDRNSRDRRRGVITKIETKVTKGWPNPRTYAVVFWFRSRERIAVNADWLFKVEERGG